MKDPFISEEAHLDGVRVYASGHGLEYTAPWLKSHWGTPKSVKATSKGSEELWTYEFGRQCWCGVIPMLVIPIPLVVPTGREKVAFVLRDDRVVSARQVKRRTCGVGAGLLSPEGPFAVSSF